MNNNSIDSLETAPLTASKNSPPPTPNISSNNNNNKDDKLNGALKSSSENGLILDSTSSPTSKEKKVAATSIATAEKVPFWPIAIVVTLIFLCHGWLAEFLVIKVVSNGYSLGWFFALLTVIGQWVPTLPKKGWKKSDGFRIEHGIVGIAHCVSLGMSNSGGMLVEYNTYSLFKSSKVVFVMIISWVMLGNQASSHELFWGCGLCAGLLMLTGADENYAKESNRITSPLTGAALLFAGISGSALVSVGQQAALQRRILHRHNNPKIGCPYTWGAPNSVPIPPGIPVPSKDDEREALLFWSNLISMFLLGAVCVLNGELQSGITFFRETATLTIWIVQFAALALVAVGQRLVLTLNGAHGATASAAVLTFRKVASFITSVMVFPKPFHPVHAVGLFVVVASAVMIQRAEFQSASNRKVKEEANQKSKIQDSV